MAASLLALGGAVPGALQSRDSLIAACGQTPGMACRLVWDVSHNGHAADFTKVYLAGPIRLTLRIALVVILALLLRSGALRLIRRLTTRATGTQDRGDRPHAVFGERRSQRATALASILGNAASVTIFTIAALIVLGDIGLNLAPVLASAGVLGIALGFGAQNLVQDFLAGIFILLEDQYGVGDIIDVSTVTGSVEAVSLRITRVRDVHGVVWHVRNGTIKKAGNETHGWARAVVDVPVPHGLPIAAARAVMSRAAVQMASETAWREKIIGQPEVWGVETIAADTLLIRVAARTAALAKVEVTRELRERLKSALDAEQASASIPRQTTRSEPGPVADVEQAAAAPIPPQSAAPEPGPAKP